VFLYVFILLIGEEDICIGVDVDHFATCDFKFGSIYMLGTQLYHILASNANKYKYKALGHAKHWLISKYMQNKQIDSKLAIFKNNLTKIVFWLFLNKKRRY